MNRTLAWSITASTAAALTLAACQNKPAPAPGPTPPGPTPPSPTQPGTAHDVVRNRELMITDLSVVNDPVRTTGTGAWTFGTLMTDMADGADASRFIVNWLKTWKTDQTVNGFVAPARPNIDTMVIQPWKAKDGVPNIADDQWRPNLANAPFRLLAIVNRMDLNQGSPARVTSAGEGRFVFGVLDATGNPLPFTVIFEYELLAKSRERLRGWAQDWHNLGTIPFGPQYNAALHAITDKFAARGLVDSGTPDRTPLPNRPKPNRSAINQIRTNEIALNFPGGWELREFNVQSDGFLHQVTVKQSPSNSFHNSADLTSFITLRAPELLDFSITLPERLDDGRNFLGAASLVAPPPGPGFAWIAPNLAPNLAEARHKFAFITCNGCHHKETGTERFLHVAPRATNQEAALSNFLTGGTNDTFEAADPFNPAVKRPFHDLADRAAILKLLAEEPGSVRLQQLQAARAARVH